MSSPSRFSTNLKDEGTKTAPPLPRLAMRWFGGLGAPASRRREAGAPGNFGAGPVNQSRFLPLLSFVPIAAVTDLRAPNRPPLTHFPQSRIVCRQNTDSQS